MAPSSLLIKPANLGLGGISRPFPPFPIGNCLPAEVPFKTPWIRNARRDSQAIDPRMAQRVQAPSGEAKSDSAFPAKVTFDMRRLACVPFARLRALAGD